MSQADRQYAYRRGMQNALWLLVVLAFDDGCVTVQSSGGGPSTPERAASS